MDKLMKDLKNEMKNVVNEFALQMKKIRTGRASLSILDGIKVEYYGNLTPLNQVATLNVPGPDIITIKPWEPNMLKKIEKAILASNIGLNPINDGKQLRLHIPPLDEERRKNLVKKVQTYLEERKTKIRNIRRDYRDEVKKRKNNDELTEDDEHDYYEDIQEVTDELTEELENIAENKEKEIMEI